MTNTDPTYQEMKKFLQESRCSQHSLEADDSDCSVAIYYFAEQWHGGQSSNLYRAIYESGFKPGPSSSIETEDPWIKDMYDDLEDQFTD